MATVRTHNRTTRRMTAVGAAAVLTLSLVMAAPPAAGAAEADCATMAQPIYQRNSPTTTTLLTPDANEARYVPSGDSRTMPGHTVQGRQLHPRVNWSRRTGWPTAVSATWSGSPTRMRSPMPGRSASRTRVTRSRSQAPPPMHRSRLQASQGRLSPVRHRRRRSGRADHVGWALEGVAFYAAPPAPTPSRATPNSPSRCTRHPAGGRPGTGASCSGPSGSSTNRANLDSALRRIHTGDFVNWDTPTHDQYVSRQRGDEAARMRPESRTRSPSGTTMRLRRVRAEPDARVRPGCG